MTTVALALVRELAVEVKAPRMIYLHWPFGHALGEPGNLLQQYTILHDALSMARAAPRPGLVVDLPYQWRRYTYEPVADWSTESDALAEALKAVTAIPASGVRVPTRDEPFDV